MRLALKILGLTIGILFLLLAGSIAADRIPLARAKPPKSVVDLNSCLAWLSKPMAAYKVSSGTNTYYMITGPAGRYLPSGPAGYAFDEQGRFLAWSSDIGDFKKPPEIFGDGVKRQRMTIDEVKGSIRDRNR